MKKFDSLYYSFNEFEVIETDSDCSDTSELQSFIDENSDDLEESIILSGLTILNAKFVFIMGKSNGFSIEPHLNIDGTITLILSINDHFVDVEINDSDQFKMRYEIGKGKKYKVIWKNRMGNINELETLLIQIKSACQHPLSESLDSKTIVQTEEDFEKTLFLIPTKEEFHYSIDNVQNLQPQMDSAHI